MRQVLILAAVAAATALFAGAPAVHAEGCNDTGWGGSCDFNFAPDGSHEHCDNAYGVPFVGNVHNCFWVNTHP